MATTYRQIAPITYQRDVFPQPVTALAFDPVSDTLWTGLNSGIVMAYTPRKGCGRIAAGDSTVRAFGVASESVGAWGKGGVNKWNHRSNVSVTAMSCNTTSITHLVSGSSDGFLRLHDPRNAMWHEGNNSVRAHTGGIQGLESSGNYIYTIGLGTRQGRPFPDPLVKVYDMRALKPLPPLPFASGPAFINMIPKRPSTLAITSHQGLVNIVDASNPTVNEFYQLDAPSYITATAVSATGAYLAFGDSDGAVHLVVPFNGFEGKPIEWADTPEPLPEIEWTDSTPMNVIGMPYYNEKLLSSWTPDFISSGLHYPPPPKIPQIILNTMKINDNVAYAALPKELRGRRNSELDTPTYEYDPDVIPKPYRKVEIEYSKFGVEDFDFAGLETHISNSYTNAMVQLMRYNLPISRLAKSHIATDCPREHCSYARGKNCQASNFCKTVGVLAQMNNAIELIDFGRETTELSYAHMIQSFHRFLVDHLSSEGNSFPHNPVLNPSPSMEKENMTHVIDMIYPGSFASILRTSLLRPTTHKATSVIRSKDLPPLLAVNAACHSEETHKVWRDNRNQTFLKPSVELHGQLEGMEDPEGAIYDLRAMVVQVVTKDQNSHLVAVVKVPDSEHHFDSDHEYSWYLFNDFVVHGITEEEALSFPSNWKVPCVLYLERVELVQRLDFSGLPTSIDRSILCRDTNIAITRDKKFVKHKPLRQDELPKPGTLVAIDAEFTEFRSDGTKKVLRPARLSLARVSVLRGEGPSEGVPFIDDHIHTSEVIVDYLTEFSGYVGDLDPRITRYTLTPLKLVYKKLRLLVDLGCIFIGHGLSKDFRIISAHLRAPEQVIDTVDLYFLPNRQRRLSLRFLAWFVLNENIQTDTHDSIEDALSALRLYKTYQMLESAGMFDEKLDELYREGKKYSWRPPAPPTAVSSATPAMMGNIATQIAQMNMNGQQMGPTMRGPNTHQSIMQTLMPAPGQFPGPHPMNMFHTPSPSPHSFSPPPWNR
ncbi:uncharacterized protein B0H18DRAFT_979313 [Fomitopsis serialis]|uniref:uncharacterized protein n=1 Tax=Fomitopsis serialis TaxID=139415 RepID=UPI00200834D7|nr:uncharacterized protein B0H18DRAFT_979313 [Neoantrodia serialis]KAH9934990.1 hypothetical protein B0H18DRAFT_979313 [Neoantrodia serialis]